MPTDTEKHGRILMKCRLCGAIDDSLHSPDALGTLLATTLEVPDPHASGISAHLVSTHQCPDGRFGVTDLVGCRLYKDEKKGGLGGDGQ